MKYLLIVLLIIFVLYYLRNNDQIEGFYTLFFPYYHPMTIQKYENLTENPYPYRLHSTSIAITPQQLRYSNFRLFLKSFIAYKDDVFHIWLNAKEDVSDRDIVKRVNSGTSNFGVVPAPILADMYDSEVYPNIRFVTTLWQQYIYIIVPTDSGIQRLGDLVGKCIGVGEKDGLWELCLNDFLYTIKMEDPVGCYTPAYGTLNELVNKLDQGEIDALIMTAQFPSQLVDYIFYNYYGIMLLPLALLKHVPDYYEKTRIDLTKLPALYVPKVIANVMYLYFNSYMDTYRFSNLLIVNKDVNDKIVEQLTEHLFDNKDLIQKATTAFTFINIPFSPGSKKIYMEKGYMSEGTHLHCKFLYGKQPCNEKTLYNNKMLRDLYYSIY